MGLGLCTATNIRDWGQCRCRDISNWKLVLRVCDALNMCCAGQLHWEPMHRQVHAAEACFWRLCLHRALSLYGNLSCPGLLHEANWVLEANWLHAADLGDLGFLVVLASILSRSTPHQQFYNCPYKVCMSRTAAGQLLSQPWHLMPFLAR